MSQNRELPPNIVLIMTDQMRGDCLGIAGHPDVKTPYLDSIAAKGILFDHAYSACPSCVPARAALHTGMRQEHHGRVGYQDMVNWNYPHTMAGELAAAGYYTQCVGKMHVHPLRNLMGFHNIELHDGYLHAYRDPAAAWEESQKQADDYFYWLKQELGFHRLLYNSVVDQNGHVEQTYVTLLCTRGVFVIRDVRSEGQIVKKAVYIAIGINLDGKKDVLGMWVGENESAKFWATVLNGLRNRGVEDIFIACTDNLTGFSAAIEAVFPKTEIQNCIIHQLRNSSKYVSYKDLKALMADLKAVYAAVDEPTALDALDTFAERWDKKYPKISQSWRDNWPNLSTYFKYPQEVRRLIYTTNTIEGFNRQLRKVTKAKSVFPTDDSLLKMLYLAMIDITKKWTGRRQDWSMIHAQLAVFFADRMPE